MPVTSQPTSSRTVTVEVPDIDVHNLIKGDWKVGHLECLKNPPICCLGWCCPCILGWINAEKLGENPLLYCLGMFIWPMGVPLRTKTREKFGISGDVVSDALLNGPFCANLTLCQVYNEINARTDG